MCSRKWFEVLFLFGIGFSEIHLAKVNAELSSEDLSFTSTPVNQIYCRVGESVSFKWTYNKSLIPVTVDFLKFDPVDNVYKTLMSWYPSRKIVLSNSDSSRIDMYDQATFRINHTVGNDAGIYKCKVTMSNDGHGLESNTTLFVQDENKKKCNMDIKSIGCFKDSINNRALGTYLASYRGRNNDEGFILDWHNYQQSIDKMLCYCAKKAKAGGFKYCGIQFYGECWAGKSSAMYNKHGASTSCIDGQFKECSTAKDIACSGKANANYVYELS